MPARDSESESRTSPIHLVAEGSYNAAPFTVDAVLGSIEALRAGPLPIEARGKIAGAAFEVRGGIAVTVIFIFLNAWNEFLFAVQLGGNTVRPVTVAMYNFVSVEQTLWAKLAAAALIAMLPVVIIGIAGQRQIVKGLTVGAVKGGGRQ